MCYMAMFLHVRGLHGFGDFEEGFMVNGERNWLLEPTISQIQWEMF